MMCVPNVMHQKDRRTRPHATSATMLKEDLQRRNTELLLKVKKEPARLSAR